MPFDQPHAYRGAEEVQLTTPGLYVFVCKLHPFMLGGVIVDDPATQGLDLGKTITLLSGATVPTASNLALRLVRAFFNITNPQNYQVYTKTGSTWDPTYPAVPVLAYDQNGNPVFVPEPRRVLPELLPRARGAARRRSRPTGKGVGEVWVDTEYEQTAAQDEAGTATAVRRLRLDRDAQGRAAVGQHEQPAQHVDGPLAVAHLPDGVVRQRSSTSSTAGRARWSGAWRSARRRRT